MKRWRPQGMPFDSTEVSYGQPACPNCPCLLARLSDLQAIDCDCRCHETQRYLLRTGPTP